MKKIFLVLAIFTFLSSCSDSIINRTIIVDKVEISGMDSCLYKVTLKTNTDHPNCYLYTNYNFQVGDTLMSIQEFKNSKNEIVESLKKENIRLNILLDSINKENIKFNLYNDLLLEQNIKTPLK